MRALCQHGAVAVPGISALISVSLRVLTRAAAARPRWGHLMYYLWEGVTGRASGCLDGALAAWRHCRTVLMMSIAMFNDISRLFG